MGNCSFFLRLPCYKVKNILYFIKLCVMIYIKAAYEA